MFPSSTKLLLSPKVKQALCWQEKSAIVSGELGEQRKANFSRFHYELGDQQSPYIHFDLHHPERQIHYSGDSRSSSCPALTSGLREFPLMPCPRRWFFPSEFCSLSLSSCAHSFYFFPHRYCSSAVISLSSSLFLPSDSFLC